jgi:hypothetical protein
MQRGKSKQPGRLMLLTLISQPVNGLSVGALYVLVAAERAYNWRASRRAAAPTRSSCGGGTPSKTADPTGRGLLRMPTDVLV